jgi:hypothetical protein
VNGKHEWRKYVAPSRRAQARPAGAQAAHRGGGREWSCGVPEYEPLYIVYFFLTPQRGGRRIAPTFWGTGVSQRVLAGRPCEDRGKLAIYAWLDGAVHQPGVRSSRTLAARGCHPHRPLQQLRRAAAQRAASAGAAATDAPTLTGRLPPAGQAALAHIWVARRPGKAAFAADLSGPSPGPSRRHAPRFFPVKHPRRQRESVSNTATDHKTSTRGRKGERPEGEPAALGGCQGMYAVSRGPCDNCGSLRQAAAGAAR